MSRPHSAKSAPAPGVLRRRAARIAAATTTLLTLGACSGMVPMGGDWSSMPQQDVDRIRQQLPGITEAAIRSTRVDYVHEVRVPCMRLMEVCYPGMPLHAKLLGSIPLACTQTFQHAWRDDTGVIVETAKTALIFSCWMTPDFVMDHEHRHAKGETHALF